MTNARARIALCVLLLAVAARAETGPNPDPFEISLGTEVGIPRGYVQVRENQLQGTHLSLHNDLGIDTIESVTVAAAYHLTPNDSLRLNFDTMFLYGSSTLSEDVLFNGALLQGGTTAESRPEFFRLTGLYERRLFDLSGGAASLATSASPTCSSPTRSMERCRRSRSAARPKRTSSPRSCRCRCSESRSSSRFTSERASQPGPRRFGATVPLTCLLHRSTASPRGRPSSPSARRTA